MQISSLLLDNPTHVIYRGKQVTIFLSILRRYNLYRFNIKGIGTDPKPSGPYEIKAGSFTFIKFKNVFDDTKMFKIYVDRDEFFVKTLYEPVRPKKVQTYL